MKDLTVKEEYRDETILPANGTLSAKRPRFVSTELLGVNREIVIEHAGEEYRLRLTRQGKLILTK